MTVAVRQLKMAELEAGLEHIRRSPQDRGRLAEIVRRPATGVREVVEHGELDLAKGLVGDNWGTRGSRSMPDGSADRDMQRNVMNARVADLVAQDRKRWQLAGDQLFVDFDLSETNVPAGTRLTIGSAVIEVTPPPHTACAKFVLQFGVDAMKFVNSPTGQALHLRGVNAKVVRSGVIRVGDAVTKQERSLNQEP